jgi:phosphoribosyl-dephospho-CoA transferase
LWDFDVLTVAKGRMMRQRIATSRRKCGINGKIGALKVTSAL